MIGLKTLRQPLQVKLTPIVTYSFAFFRISSCLLKFGSCCHYLHKIHLFTQVSYLSRVKDYWCLDCLLFPLLTLHIQAGKLTSVTTQLIYPKIKEQQNFLNIINVGPSFKMVAKIMNVIIGENIVHCYM